MHILDDKYPVKTAAEWPAFRRRLWAGVVLLNLLVAGISAYFAYYGWSIHAEQASKETRNLALLLEREISGTFDSVDLVLKELSGKHAGKSILAADSDHELRRMRDYLPLLSGLRGVDAEGRVVAGLLQGESPETSIADRDYFIGHRDKTKQGLIISQPVFGRMTKQWSLIFSRRLEGPDGRFSGIVAASLPLKHFAQRFESLKIGNHGSIGLRDNELRLIWRHPELAGDIGIGSTKVATDFTNALSRDTSKGSYRAGATTIDGVRRFHSYHHNAAYGFYLNVGIAEDEYLSAWRSELYRSGVFFAGFLAVSLLLALFLRNAWRRQELTNAALQSSESRFRVMFEQAGVGVAQLDSSTGRFIRANRKYAEIVGYSLEELESLDFQSITHPQDIAADLNNMVLLRSGAISQFSMEKRYIQKNGGIVWVNLTVSPMWPAGSAPKSHIAIVEDISRRKQAEIALHESEARIRGFFDNVPVGIFISTRDEKFAYINATLPKIMGYTSREEMLNVVNARSIPEVLYADPPQTKALNDHLDLNAPEWVTYESRYRRKDGMIIDAEITISERIDENAGEARFYGIVSDVSARKQMAERLRLEEERFRSFVENANDVLFVLTREGRFHYLSPQWTEAFGYDLRESIGHPFAHFVHPEDIAACAAFLLKTFSTGEKQSGIEYRVRCKDGRVVWYRANASIIRDPETGEMMFVGIGRDITQIKAVENELISAKRAAESASRAKSRFLAAASHDLRQPVQAISLFQDALARTNLNREQKRISDYLAQSTRSLSELLDALLDISKLDAGVVEASSEVIQAATLIQKIDSEFSSVATGKSLRFKLHFPFRDIAIMTDGKLLISLLGNLVGNAIKYTEKGGVLVAIRRRRDQALFQVWDTGIGIPAEHLDTIFEEYFQVGNAERDRAKGLGLGLAIAKRIGKLLNTEVACRSRPGKGSVFEFRLPLASRAEKATPDRIDPPEAAHEATPAGRRIVLVEDDLLVATAMKLAVEASGMTVTRYKTAEEALEDSAIAEADFYISDLRLPGLGGVEFLEAVQRRATKPIKAVIVTGDTAIDRIEMMRSISWPVLFKPVELATLLSEIESQDLTD